MKEMVLGQIFPQNEKFPNSIQPSLKRIQDSLGEVADKGPLYMFMKKMGLEEIPQNEKIPKLK